MSELNQFDYFTDIEKAFIKRRGKHLLIGTLDWALIESWQTRGIPLRIVLRGIDSVFDAVDKRGEQRVLIRSLKYCSDAVESAFAEWSSAHIGKTKADDEIAVSTESGVSQHIERCVAGIRKILKNVPLEISDTLKDTLSDIERIDIENEIKAGDALEALDESINKSILGTRESFVDIKIKNAFKKELSAFGDAVKPGTDAYQRVFCKVVRSELGIPRLSIYEL